MEITKPLNLAPEQAALLDLHSFLNIANIVIGEMHLVSLALNESAALPGSLKLATEIKELIAAGRITGSFTEKLAALKARFAEEMDEAIARHPEMRAAPEMAESRQNLESILKVMDVRAAEYLARAGQPDQWQPHPVAGLTDNFLNFFAAVEKNSRGRYRIIFNIAAQEGNDYLVNFRIESVDGGTLVMPPVLQDIFRDLIANARKYTPPGGEINAGLYDNGQELRLVVEDTGRGIPPAEVEKVVDFGYRASNSDDVRTQGGGFGLTKAYVITKRLGGRFWVESSLGKGTRVTICIPRPVAESPPRRP